MPVPTSTSKLSSSTAKDSKHSFAQFAGDFACSTAEAQIFIEAGGAQPYADIRAAQLDSLLCLLCGNGGDTFRNYSDEIQDNVLWLASSLAHDLRKVLELLPDDTRKGCAK